MGIIFDEVCVTIAFQPRRRLMVVSHGEIHAANVEHSPAAAQDCASGRLVHCVLSAHCKPVASEHVGCRVTSG
jgi:hypothetical protein